MNLNSRFKRKNQSIKDNENTKNEMRKKCEKFLKNLSKKLLIHHFFYNKFWKLKGWRIHKK